MLNGEAQIVRTLRIAGAARGRRGLTLIEILIALFIFMLGVIGVLSMFPVAMNTAAEAMGEVRGSALAQSAIDQIIVDCQAAMEEDDVHASIASTASTLVRASSTEDFSGYYVTLTSGDGAGQCRRVTGISGTTLNVAPNWTTVGGWSFPLAGETYIITRIGLPDPADIAPDFREYGLERQFYVRRVIDANTVELGRLSVVETDDGMSESTGADTLTDDDKNWTPGMFIEAHVEIEGASGTQLRKITANTSDTLTVDSNWNPAIGNDVKYKLVPTVKRMNHLASTFAALDTVTTTSLRVDGATWTPNQFVDHLIRIKDGNGKGLVRRIVMNTTDTITVTPEWDSSLLAVGNQYELGWADGTLDSISGTPDEPNGFLVVTSGRSAPRVYAITTVEYTAANGLRVTCDGANFQERGVSGGDMLQDATTVTIIGNDNTEPENLRTLLPVSGPWSATPYVPSALNLSDHANTFGLMPPDSTKRQTLEENFGLLDTDNEIASDYSVVAVFSDSGTLPNGPVRVDVFVYRNFDTNKTLAENQKPVAHRIGYVGRP